MMNSIECSEEETQEWKSQAILRVLAAGITIDPPSASYSLRVPENYEFIWIMEGDAVVHFDQQVIQATKGTVLLRRANVRGLFEWSEKKRTVHAYIQFDLDPKHRAMLSKSSVPSFRKLPKTSEIHRPMFGYLLSLNEQKEPLRTELIKPVLACMVQCYATGLSAFKSQPVAHLSAPVQKAVEIIQRSISHTPPVPLRLNQLAKDSYTTPQSLCRWFKKELEVGPLEYAKLVRLDRAAKQLEKTTLNLKEIALSNSFYDAYHFSKSFKRVYGLSPREFKKSVH